MRRVGGLRTLPGRYGALDHRFAVDTDDQLLGGWLEAVLAPLEDGVEAAGRYELRGGPPASLSFDGAPIAEGPASYVLGMLLWHVNREAVARSPGVVRLHAAAAARDDAAVLLPAAMESGKTTLVAGLVRAGLRYLSDEVAAVDPDNLRIRAYPKALSIDPGSWDVLADLRPEVPEQLAPLLPLQWIVPAGSVRPGAELATAEPRLLIAPRYEAGARSRLVPLSRVEALLHAAGSTFELGAHAARDLPVLGRLVERCACYRLVVGDLDEACRLVLDALDAAAGAR